MVKRLICLILIAIMIMSGIVPVFAKGNDERDQILLTDAKTGKAKSYKTVNLIMGGKDVISDIPAILYEVDGKARTLVPIRFIIDELGADVAWDNDKKEATIKLKDKTIVLKANSAEALVDGKPYTLPDKVPVKLMGIEYNYRTMVPVRFVSEQLGLDVGWIGSTQTVTVNKALQSVNSVKFNGNAKHPEMIFKTSGEVEYSSFYIKGSDAGAKDKIVIEMANTLMNMDDRSKINGKGVFTYPVGKGGIASVEGVQAQVTPYKTRFTISLDKKAGYELQYTPETNELRVSFNNTLGLISSEKVNNAEAVIVRTAEEPIYNVKTWNNKVIVDFMNTKLKVNGGKPGTVDVNRGGVETIAYSQFDPGEEYDADEMISRVVVNLKPGQSPEDVYIEHVDTDVFIFVSGNPLDGIDYGKDTFDSAHLNINLSKKGEYKAEFDKSARVLEITVPPNSMSIGNMDLDFDDNLIENITVNHTSEASVIKLKLEKGTTYTDKNEDGAGTKLKFVLTNGTLQKSNYKGKIIVLDPGHGAHDPGATSVYSGTKEKELALKVALKLRKKLENIGFKVVMTRDDDTYIDLYKRAEIANTLGADLFVSVHFNAMPEKAAINGIEMLYVPSAERDNAGFAKVMQSELCKTTGAYSRGLIARPNLVVIRETKMPAVIAELGYLTNVEEEKKCLDSAYHDRLAEGLYNGIIKYVK